MTKESKDKSTPAPFQITFGESEWHISLPWSAFFDQELWSVIFDKLMKAPVKDYQVLLRLTKLGNTVNQISHELSKVRDDAAKEAGLWEFLSPESTLTPETLNSSDYQEKSKKFSELLQDRIFSKTIDLAPLWSLTLDLTNPDGHAKSFLENSNLSADDVDMLDKFGIVKIIYPTNEEEKDVLIPNEDN